jgi:NAD(P)-dependent dehydrogenase (short-subunit alcohol dehydrogenase family)
MNKAWFVTGASSGIGTGVVRAALEAGDRVVATARNVEKLRPAIGQPASDRLAYIPLDVTNEQQAQAALAAAVEKFFAGSDAVSGITADLKARLEDVEAHKDLSSSTDGSF